MRTFFEMTAWEPDDGAFADFTVGTDDGIRFDNYIFMKFGSRINNGRFMNLRLR